MGKLAITSIKPSELWGYDYISPQYITLGKMIRERMNDLKCSHVISQANLGIEQISCLIAMKTRQLHPDLHITIEIVVPYENREQMWNDDNQLLYRKILDNADIITVLSKNYSKLANRIANEYIVNTLDELLAIWDGKRSYIADMVTSASAYHKSVSIIRPQSII